MIGEKEKCTNKGTDKQYLAGSFLQLVIPKLCTKLNQKTNGTVNAHLISGSCISVNHTNDDEKFRSFKSKANIHKKDVEPYLGFSY